MEAKGTIGTSGSYDVKFDASLVMTASASVTDGKGASVNSGITVDVGQELLNLANQSGNSEAVTIVKGLISIMPLLVNAFPSAAPAGATSK